MFIFAILPLTAIILTTFHSKAVLSPVAKDCYYCLTCKLILNLTYSYVTDVQYSNLTVEIQGLIILSISYLRAYNVLYVVSYIAMLKMGHYQQDSITCMSKA